jgi:hypothetical protein
MERVTPKTFDKRCPLLCRYGYRIKGGTDKGMLISNSGVLAIPRLLFVCSICRFKNCSSSAAVDNKHEITVKIN